MKTITRVPVDKLLEGQNARSNLGDLTQLSASIAIKQDKPIEATRLGDGFLIIDGYRRVAAAKLAGLTHLDCIIEEEATPAEIEQRQLRDFILREDITPADKAFALKRQRDAGLNDKQIGEAVGLHSSQVGRYLLLFDTIEDVQEAAKAGKIGVSDWAAISKSPDQAATLHLKLSGANREQLKASTRPKAPAVRSAKLTLPLPSGQKVVVSGDEVSLEEALETLAEASKLIKAGIAKGLSAKTAMRVWSDMAGN